MIKVGNYCIVENRADYDEHLNPVREDLFEGAVLPNNFNIEEMNFPFAFELSPAWDAHFLDSWYVIEVAEAKEKMLQFLNEGIEIRQKMIMEIKEKI